MGPDGSTIEMMCRESTDLKSHPFLPSASFSPACESTAARMWSK